jgi:GDP-4-dehydro-6-deoxy-D-mannose reductase
LKALVIGGAGFVGNYLIERLICEGHKVYATCLANEKIENAECESFSLDILDKSAVKEILSDVKPDWIFHLAAQSSVSYSWKNPQLTVDVNIKGTVNVLDAMRESGLDKTRIILIGSGEEYGYIREGACPIKETEQLNPGNIYAATKACQSMIGSIYARAYGMDIVMVRAFNHIGPAQLTQFVVADFCNQAAEIEKGNRKPEISVGNLAVKRDFTDVRDIVRAYELLAEKGVSGKIYNVGSGKAVLIEDILKLIVSKSTAEITVSVDKARLRPADVPVIEADISEIKADTGWEPEISLEKTIEDTLNYWRNIN